MKAREAAEQKQLEYKAKMLSMQDEMEQTHKELEAAQDRIRRLEDELYELNQVLKFLTTNHFFLFVFLYRASIASVLK